MPHSSLPQSVFWFGLLSFLIRDIKKDTTDIKDISAAIKTETVQISHIKQDTSQISRLVQEISLLRRRLDQHGEYNVLQRFLAESTSYAESVIDPPNSDLDETESFTFDENGPLAAICLPNADLRWDEQPDDVLTKNNLTCEELADEESPSSRTSQATTIRSARQSNNKELLNVQGFLGIVTNSSIQPPEAAESYGSWVPASRPRSYQDTAHSSKYGCY